MTGLFTQGVYLYKVSFLFVSIYITILLIYYMPLSSVQFEKVHSYIVKGFGCSVKEKS